MSSGGKLFFNSWNPLGSGLLAQTVDRSFMRCLLQTNFNYMRKPRFAESTALQGLRQGPLGPHLDSFADLLSQLGYCQKTGWLKIRLVAELSRWLHQRHTPVGGLNEAQTAAFLNVRWKRVAARAGDRATMTLLLRHLRQIKVIARPPEAAAGGDIDLMALDYEDFLLRERGLMPSSTETYLGVARRFLSYCFPSGSIHLAKLKTKDISDFVLHDTSHRGRRSAQLMATVLRSFLSFLFQKSRIASNLAAAVPTVPNRRLADLPHYLETKEVKMVLGSCDRRRKVGKRDYAILLVMARLGLRASEVIHLTLDDINWRAGELLVRGKGTRVDRLPLVQDVGQALADYLQGGRPDCSSRNVFIQCRAPFEGFARPSSISGMVCAALTRAHLSPPYKGAHVLRHSLATGMLRNGASLAQIGQVLRHQLPQTTEIYAKVDFKALRALALPWPGGGL